MAGVQRFLGRDARVDAVVVGSQTLLIEEVSALARRYTFLSPSKPFQPLLYLSWHAARFVSSVLLQAALFPWRRNDATHLDLILRSHKENFRSVLTGVLFLALSEQN